MVLLVREQPQGKVTNHMSEMLSANGKLEEWPIFARVLQRGWENDKGGKWRVSALRAVASVIRPEEAVTVEALLAALPEVYTRLTEKGLSPATAQNYCCMVVRDLRKAGHATPAHAWPATMAKGQRRPDTLDKVAALKEVASWLRQTRTKHWKSKVTALRCLSTVASEELSSPEEALHKLPAWRVALVDKGLGESLIKQYVVLARSGIRNYLAANPGASESAPAETPAPEVTEPVEPTPSTSTEVRSAVPLPSTLRADMWPVFVRVAHTFTIAEVRDLLLRVAALAADFDPERTVLDQVCLMPRRY